MKISSDKDFKKEEIELLKYNECIYNIKCKNTNFFIEPKIVFNNCSYLIIKNLHKIRININLENLDHKNFKELINKIYNAVSLFIEKEDAISIFNIMNPINPSLKLDKIDVFYLIVNKNAEIYEYGTNILINTEILKNKRFDFYPLINTPSINIKGEYAYINFYLKKGYLKFTSEYTSKKNVDIDEMDLNNAFNKNMN
jgi:hypothetical protein